MTRHKRAIVIGAGIGGLSAATALRRAGFEVDIFERATELAEKGAGLGVTSNAVSALRTLGIQEQLETHGQVIDEFKIHDERGHVLVDMPFRQVQDEIGVRSVSIHRAALQRILLQAAQGCTVHLARKCTRFESDDGGVCAHFDTGESAQADLLIGADGLYSAVRRQMAGDEAARYAGYVCWLATIPYAHPRFPTGYVGFYWGRGVRFGLIDIGGGQAYWWATQNQRERCDPNQSGASIKQHITRCFAGWADEVTQAIAATPETALLQLDALDRPFLQRWGSGRVTLLGDAAHPMLTSLGQGACQAMEDAVVLGSSLTNSEDLTQSLRRYEDARRVRTRYMVRASHMMATVEQFENPIAVALRNTYFRLQRRSAHLKQTRPLMNFVDPLAQHAAQ